MDSFEFKSEARGKWLNARLKSPWTLGAMFGLGVLLTACGGGGAGGGGASGGSGEEPQSLPGDTGESTGPALNLGSNSFYFEANAALAEPEALSHVAGGRLVAAWNPSDARTALSPGMKVIFFGKAEGCPYPMQGPVDTFGETHLAEVARRTTMSATAATPSLRWTPSGQSNRCNSAAQARSGETAVFLSADDANGGVGMLTTTGDSSGAKPFFGTFSTGGQDGQGTNAGLQVSVTSFRQNPDLEEPIRPWLSGSATRVRSVQSIGSALVDGGDGQLVQVKQQIGLSFLNRQCFAERNGKPCQIQYLMNTAIYRRGVSDWSTMRWFANGHLMYDPVQGGIPVVDGPIHASGTPTLDMTYDLPMWSSQGSASQHGRFSDRTFDVTISFDQFINALKITTANYVHLSPGQVTNEQIAELWGGGWNDRSQWVLLQTDVGQEVYNPDEGFRAEIGGGFRSLYVGPQ